MHKLFSLAALILLAGCGDDRAAPSDAEKIAEVERASIAPPAPLEPQPLRFVDLERADLLGGGCRFMASDGEDRLLFIGLADRGAMKVDGVVERYAPDRGGEALGHGAWRQYDGLARSVRLEMGEAAATQSDSEAVDHPGSMVVRDGRDRVVFEAEGTVQCGA